MSDQELRQLALRFYEEIFNQGRLDTIDELMEPDAVIHGGGLDVRPVRGPSDLKEQVLVLRDAFPDLHIEVQDLVVRGDVVTVRAVVRGTHAGPGLGIPPTGRATCVHGLTQGRWLRGRLVEGWSHWDLLSFYRQLDLFDLFGHAGRAARAQPPR